MPSSTQFHSPTLPTVSQRTLSRRQWIGVSVAALLLVIATMAVMFHRGSNTVPALIAALNDTNEDVRQHAKNALVGIGREAVPALIAALNNTHENVRWGAMDALGKIGPDAREAIPVLITTLKDEDSQQHAAYALGGIGREAVPALISALKDANVNFQWRVNVRWGAIDALGKIGPDAKEAVPALIAAMKGKYNSSGYFGERVTNALVGIGRDAVPALIAALKGEDDGYFQVCFAARALGKIGPDAKEAVPALIAALKDAHPVLRIEAASALIHVQPDAKEPFPALIEELKYEDDYVLASAAEALAEIKPAAKDAIPALEECLGRIKDIYRRRQIQSAIRKIKESQ